MSLLTVQNLQQHFPVRGGVIRRAVASCKAVDGVSFSLAEGETLGLVGESGCGKTTLGKAIVRLLKPTGGQIDFEGHDITHASMRSIRPLRRHMQMIFQDPAESLNPRHTVRDILEEPYIVQKIGSKEERRKWVLELLDKVGLGPRSGHLPSELSGGEQQRVAIARALANRPSMLFADEPTGNLDSKTGGEIIDLLLGLARENGTTLLAVTHDTKLAARGDRVLHIRDGQLEEN
jgi:ABC-type glutathione transport system ATPase component